MIAKASLRFDDDGGSVGQHFGDALHHFVGTAAHADDGVRARGSR